MNKNKNYWFIGVLAVGSLSVAWNKGNLNEEIRTYQAHLNTSGSVAGRTGAPGEPTCTECHGGQVIGGSSENVFTLFDNGVQVSTYEPNVEYDVRLQLASNPVKKGFQTTVLNSSNQFAGSFASSNGGVSIKNGAAGKKYAGQTSQGSSGANFPFWTFKWTAPSTNQGNVTFYVASNVSNNNGSDNGDQIHTSQFNFGSTASIKENSSTLNGFVAGFAVKERKLTFQFNSKDEGETYLNLLDATGKSVLNGKIGRAEIGANKDYMAVPEYIKAGVYFVHFFVNNNSVSQSVVVQ